MLFITNLIFGIGLLISGRKLFWLFVAAAGFVTGVALMTRFSKGPEWLAILVGIAVGVLFAALAVALKTVAISLAGFLFGGSALISIAGMVGFDGGAFSWIIYVAGGILGIIFISAFFDWALIGISSLAGSSMLVQTLALDRPVAGLVFVILLIIGIFLQAMDKRKEHKAHDR